jgi:hypothetical protein
MASTKRENLLSPVKLPSNKRFSPTLITTGAGDGISWIAAHQQKVGKGDGVDNVKLNFSNQ